MGASVTTIMLFLLKKVRIWAQGKIVDDTRQKKFVDDTREKKIVEEIQEKILEA